MLRCFLPCSLKWGRRIYRLLGGKTVQFSEVDLELPKLFVQETHLTPPFEALRADGGLLPGGPARPLACLGAGSGRPWPAHFSRSALCLRVTREGCRRLGLPQPAAAGSRPPAPTLLQAEALLIHLLAGVPPSNSACPHPISSPLSINGTSP